MPPLCYTEKAISARDRLERQCNECGNHKKQCRPTETKPDSNAIHPCKRHNSHTNSNTPSRIKSTQTRRTHTGMRPHAPGKQAGATQYLHIQSVTTLRRCGRSNKHEAPRELSAHRGISISAVKVKSKVSKGWGGSISGGSGCPGGGGWIGWG